MSFNYYEAPNQDVFDDIKANAIAIWQTYDDIINVNQLVYVNDIL